MGTCLEQENRLLAELYNYPLSGSIRQVTGDRFGRIVFLGNVQVFHLANYFTNYRRLGMGAEEATL